MNNKLLILFAGVLMLATVSSARADTLVQLWTCEIKEGKTRAELLAVSADWMKAVNAMESATEFEAYIEFPIASDDVSVFTFVMIADSAKNWGAWDDAYAGSPAAKVDEAWSEIAECSSSSLWNSVKIE